MSDWKLELGTALGEPLTPQALTCEQAFVEGLASHGRKAAQEFVQEVLNQGKKYFECKFGAGTPQAQAGFADLTTIVTQCATSNLGLLLRGGFAAFSQAVLQCVVGKLLGGIVGGGGIGIGGFHEKEVNRCGQ
jgi:hypothetical protein